MNGPIIEGHEQALWILAAGFFVAILYLGFVRYFKNVWRFMEARKKPRVLRPFRERDAEYDPYADENNLGRK